MTPLLSAFALAYSDGLFVIVVFWLVAVPLLNAFTAATIIMGDLPSNLAMLFGSSYLGYGAYREYGKTQRIKSGLKL